jgi:hypothetical protein
VGPDSSVGIVTRYRLEGPGIESWWGLDFPHSSTLAKTHPAFYTMVTVSFPGVKWPGPSSDHLPSSSTKVKERVELYFYSPCGPFGLF